MLLSSEFWGWGTCAVTVCVAARSGTISSTNITKRRDVIIADLNEFIVDVLSLDSLSVVAVRVSNPDCSPV